MRGQISTRQTSNLCLDSRITGKIRSTYDQGFAVRSAKLWNLLPSEITNELVFCLFVRKLDKWMEQYPDEPPVHGYFHVHNNSFLDYNMRKLNSNGIG